MPILPNSILAEVSSVSDDGAVLQRPLSNASFTLDSSGVAGFFGGDSSVAGMATVNLIPYRRWGGWYNTPGSYEIAKRYGPLAKSKLCDGLFPEGEHDPTRLFGIDGQTGPQFIAIHSGSSFARTGHLGHLLTSKAHDMPCTRAPFASHARATASPPVTIVNLRHVPRESDHPHLPRHWEHSALFSLAPIMVSVGACVLCALVADWFCFASIAVGIVAHGSACYIIGSGKLTFKHPKPAPDAPPGDGVLKGDKDVVILVGDEGAVNAFTRGRFRLQYGAEPDDLDSEAQRRFGHPKREGTGTGTFSEKETVQVDPRSRRSWIPRRHLIGPCALLLMAQFLAQLLLIPLGTLFGQIMFIASLIASWAFNTYLSAIDREEIQTEILFNVLQVGEEDIQKYQLRTWTATVAFTCFVLASVHPIEDPLALLDAMLPNNTEVWRAWKMKMAAKLRERRYFGRSDAEFKFSDDDSCVVGEKHQGLLKTFFRDAENAWDAWSEVRDFERMVALRRPFGIPDV